MRLTKCYSTRDEICVARAAGLEAQPMNTMAKLREDSVSSAREFRIGVPESHWTYHFERTVDHPIGGEVVHQCMLIPC